MDLRVLQSEHEAWRARNFPEQTSTQALLGVTEELGELCHAVLKEQQGIRGSSWEHRAAAADAVGDVVLFLTGFCSLYGLDLSTVVEQAWDEVSRRDWTANPHDGAAPLDTGVKEQPARRGA